MKTFKDISSLSQTPNGVQIAVENVDGSSQKIEEMVQNCKTGQCSCLSKETKEKIENIQFVSNAQEQFIQIDGDISTEEIQKAIQQSKMNFNQ
jgi:hypothetical protein